MIAGPCVAEVLVAAVVVGVVVVVLSGLLCGLSYSILILVLSSSVVTSLDQLGQLVAAVVVYMAAMGHMKVGGWSYVGVCCCGNV